MADKKKKKRNKRRRGGVFLWLVLIVVVIAAAFIFLAQPLFDINLRNLVLRRSTEAVSMAVLEETRDVLSFQTIEYVYKAVFPYDFVEPEYDWRALLQKAATDADLTDSEREHLEFYSFCRGLGIRLLTDRYEFAVITATVRAGFNLMGTPFENPDTNENIEHYIAFDKETRRLILKLPDPVIADFIIEDETSEAYPYPDIAIGPAKWKELTAYAEEKIREKVIQEGILEQAEERGKEFLRRIFLDSGTGISEIVFID